MDLMTEPSTIRNPGPPTGGYDDYGAPITGPGAETPAPCWYEPRGSSEDTAAKDQQVDGYWYYVALGTPLTAASVVVLNGAEYQVVGEPGRQPGGFLVPGFLKAALERVRG
ncbi:head-to-tail stopper [Arthrobacter phage Aoka]|nr:head-to-tail stopper [Arthrobacter phage Aoka]